MENHVSIKTEINEQCVKLNFQCWIEFYDKLGKIEYQRFRSFLVKDIKKIIFELKTKENHNVEYFVDLTIRDSPSTTAFLTLDISLLSTIKNDLLNNVQNVYIFWINDYLNNNKYFKVFFNNKKRK